ncbi:hypothetical protein N7450_011865 [Penicillium hetheringtonii]|uniref:Glycosyl transferase CAP10 domain-containing protein n=1 Tax=Penicillium hetheringtonii TaxID=911720 RepID=A0AAD6DAQ8_9EURO|nr:hypothetical protein N7450_011865 [Penicillium hetheringtonii]
MLTPSFPSVFSSRKYKTIATFAAASLIIFTCLHLFETPYDKKFSISSHLPSTGSCPRKIAETDSSALAFRCRIQAAQENAKSALKAQSSTPEQAIAEYRRRYKRNPPKGFSKWVQFALEHDSKVIDDFDQIDRDLEYYRTPEARRAFERLNAQKDNWPFTRRVIVQDGAMNRSGWYMYDDFWSGLVEPFIDEIPDNFMFYMSTIDEPRILSKSGQQPTEIEFTTKDGHSIEDLVKDSCTQIPRQLTSRLGHEKDVCKFDDPGKLHALITSPSSFSYTHSPVPILSFGRMSAFRDILIPCPCYAAHPLLGEDKVPFLDKKPSLYWRGSSTGGQASRFNWRFGHRQRFVAFVQALQNAANVLDASRHFGFRDRNLNDRRITLFKDMFDVQMGDYKQCELDGDRTACKDMERVLGPSNFEPEDTSINYRYLFDLDGNSMSTRFYRLLSRRAVVLKQTWFHEWHDDRLIPWAHYIPVTMEMNELPDLMDFLVNDPEGERLSGEIAEAGYTWSKQVLRGIDISIYLYRLFLELAELYGPVDPESEGFKSAAERIP